MSEIKTNKISPRKGTTQTIGDSGDTVTIPCGVTTTNAGTITTAGISGGTINNSGGTISGLAGVINWDTTAKTANFNAAVQSGYFVNTTSGAITVTFPASPTAGDVIALKDYANTFNTNNLTIDPNGNKIQGSTVGVDITVDGASSQFIYVDSTRGWVLTDASKASDIAQVATFITATGGCITTCGDYKIHTFTSPGTFCVSSLGNAPTNPLGGPSNVDYLVVAGGAGGGSAVSGSAGGGGGAGGYRTSFPTCGGALTVTATAYPITVGAGGAGTNGSYIGSPNPGATGGQGSNSIFSTITSSGGGGGGGATSAAVPGGSGGGGSAIGTEFYPPGYTDVAGTGNSPPVSPSQGNNGGTGCSSSPNSVNFAAGGGGGANATGGNGGPTGGPGGAGKANSISGSPVTYAGGGGGGNRACGSGAGIGTGGSGGGGNGGQGPSPASASTAGTANTGGGGGGAGIGNQPCASGVSKGAAGGSGIVIIRYKYQ